LGLVGLGALNPNDTFSHPSFFGFGIVLSRSLYSLFMCVEGFIFCVYSRTVGKVV